MAFDTPTLHSYLLRTELSDLKITIDGYSFPAHRAIIGFGSHILKSMILTEAGMEAETPAVLVLSLNFSTPAVILRLLQFLYTGRYDEDVDVERWNAVQSTVDTVEGTNVINGEEMDHDIEGPQPRRIRNSESQDETGSDRDEEGMSDTLIDEAEDGRISDGEVQSFIVDKKNASNESRIVDKRTPSDLSDRLLAHVNMLHLATSLKLPVLETLAIHNFKMTINTYHHTGLLPSRGLLEGLYIARSSQHAPKNSPISDHPHDSTPGLEIMRKLVCENYIVQLRAGRMSPTMTQQYKEFGEFLLDVLHILGTSEAKWKSYAMAMKMQKNQVSRATLRQNVMHRILGRD